MRCLPPAVRVSGTNDARRVRGCARAPLCRGSAERMMKKTQWLALALLLAGAGFSVAADPAENPNPIPPASEGSLTSAPNCCPGTGCCTEHPRFWASGEFLLWWFKSSPVGVPLITDGPIQTPNTGTGPLATTQFLAGNGVTTGVHSGARFSLGYWLDSGATFGIEGSYFFVPRKTTTRTITGTGAAGEPAFGVPFFDSNPLV